MTDGSSMFVNTLSADVFILEKMKAYESRRYERDLYDIYHLMYLSYKYELWRYVCTT
jgi:predicted nucleotidyltransferase component of viral defense system